MNFYILNNDQATINTLRDVIEADFDNVLIGVTDDPVKAYDDMLQLRVDIMLISYELSGTTGISLIESLEKVHSNPRFIMTVDTITPAIKSAAYQAGCDFILTQPLNLQEAKHMIRFIATQVKLISRLRTIYDLSATSTSPYQLPQADQRQQFDQINRTLRFLGISAENGSKDIRRIIRLMVDQNIEFNEVDFERDLNLTEHQKKVVYQRIRRAIKAGIANLAAMCIDYPENDVLLEYANNLFEYQNVHIEIQHLKNAGGVQSKVSIQHFFDGLLQGARAD